MNNNGGCKDLESAFWEYFLMRNYMFKTVVFGGDNPVYAGCGLKEEKEYQSKYMIENDEDMVCEGDREEVKRYWDMAYGIVEDKPVLRERDFDVYEEDRLVKSTQEKRNEVKKMISKYNMMSRNALPIQVKNKPQTEKDDSLNDTKPKNSTSHQSKNINKTYHKVSRSNKRFAKNKNATVSIKFLQPLKKFKEMPLNLLKFKPKSKDISKHLRIMSETSFWMNDKLKIKNKEGCFLPDVMNQLKYYHNVRDKLLEVMYNKFPLSEDEFTKPGSVDVIKTKIKKAGLEVTDLIKHYKNDCERGKYAYTFEYIKHSFIKILKKLNAVEKEISLKEKQKETEKEIKKNEKRAPRKFIEIP